MVLSFHGKGKNMIYQSKLSCSTEPAINPDMVAVFPQGLEGDDGDTCWQGPHNCNPSAPNENFTSDVVQYMKDNYYVDERRVYASGKLVGGGFVNILACSQDHGGQFAAFAIDAGTFYNEADGTECLPARSPMPMLELHGTDGETASYYGDVWNRQILPSVRRVLEAWGLRNGCPEPNFGFQDSGWYLLHALGLRS